MKIQYIILIILYVAITIIYADDCCYEELDLKYKLKRLASSCQGKSQTTKSRSRDKAGLWPRQIKVRQDFLKRYYF